MYNFYCILFMSNSLDFFFSYVSWMQYFFLNIFERVGLLDRVGKKPVVADKRVYRVSRLSDLPFFFRIKFRKNFSNCT